MNTASMAGPINPAGNALYGVTKRGGRPVGGAVQQAAGAGAAVRLGAVSGLDQHRDLRSSGATSGSVRRSAPVRTTPESEIRRKQVESARQRAVSGARGRARARRRARGRSGLTHPRVEASVRHRLEGVLEGAIRPLDRSGLARSQFPGQRLRCG